MQDTTPSRTATVTTFLRALHLAVDDTPPVLADELAVDLLPAYQQRFIRRLAALAPAWRRRYRLHADTAAAIRAQVVVRSRYAEDTLALAHASGVRHYLVLAAGLDTSAWRVNTRSLAVTEIDHPATQSYKRRLLAERGIAEPANVSYLPLDFERQTLGDVWPYTDTPVCVSWLGVSYYLSRDAIAHTLATLAARSAPGSRLVLDYWSEPALATTASPLFWSARIGVAMLREPMQSFFTPAAIAVLARDAGWRVHEQLPAPVQTRRYLCGRDDALAVPAFAHLLQLER